MSLFDKLFGLDKPQKPVDDVSELLTTAYGNEELAAIEALLRSAEIPYRLCDRGAGGIVRVISGYTMYGTDVFVRTEEANRVYSIHGKAVTLCGEAGGSAAKMGQYLFGCLTPDREDKRQNGQRFNTGEKFYTLTALDRHGVLVDGYIRKLTPTECERLQTLPDGYTDGVNEPQRYKCLGNGWTVDVIAHILKHIGGEKNENHVG